jgi:hypothetical protein
MANPDSPVANTANPDSPVANTANPDSPVVSAANPDSPVANTANPDSPVVSAANPDSPVASAANPEKNSTRFFQESRCQSNKIQLAILDKAEGCLDNPEIQIIGVEIIRIQINPVQR